MIDDSLRKRSKSRDAVLAIATGGFLAGVLDLTQAITLFGRSIPLAIAAVCWGRGLSMEARPHTFLVCSCTS
jgi:uncharacterized membrane protein